MSLSNSSELLFEIEEDDGLLKELLEGRVIEVERDEEVVMLTFSDGRKVLLVVSHFGIHSEDLPRC